jgi:Fic family protein
VHQRTNGLAELKQAAGLTPNQTILINTIPLLEAKDSCEIENIVTTTGRLFQHAQGENQADPATKEALRYRSALHKGYNSLKDRPLCTASSIKFCLVAEGAVDAYSFPKNKGEDYLGKVYLPG